MSADFWVVQHVAELFRNEPRNIGVIVKLQDRVFAKFFGEDTDQRLDGRRIKALPYPDVYRQWVHYWRSNLGNINSLVQNTKDHYRIGVGGKVSDLQDGDLYAVADHLYSVLVSEGGIAEALTQKQDSETPGVALELEIERAFAQLDLLVGSDADATVSHPIARQASIAGKVATHKPAFSQSNGHLCVIESVDLTSPKRRNWRDHSGFIAYMFRDIVDKHATTERVTLIRASNEDRDTEEGRYALKVLANESQIVDWSDAQQRDAFVSHRRVAANS